MVPDAWELDRDEMRLRVNDLACQDLFIQAIPKVFTATAAARAAGVDLGVVYRWRSSPDFNERERLAREQVADKLEREAIRRAVSGVRKPIYQAGILVGYSVEYSDPLLLALLKAAKPDKYRERSDITVTPIVKVVAGFEPGDVL